MLNPRLAGRYAKSLIDLANERGELELVHNDMQFLNQVIKSSQEFANLLKSPVIKPDKKTKIVDTVTKGRIGEMTAGFNRLLISKGRESNLPEIIKAFIEQYKRHKGIQTVKLITAVPVSEEIKAQIVEKVKQETGIDKIDLITELKPDIIGGFRLEIGDTLVDASISYDLSKVKSQFLNNDFIYKIR